MSLRHFAAPRLRHSLLVTSLLLAGSFSAHASEEMLRKAVGNGAYDIAYSQQENARWCATSQSRSLDNGGVCVRLDPTTAHMHAKIKKKTKPAS
ncbi:YncE family protein, partial [Klebsiella pneumoniae]